MKKFAFQRNYQNDIKDYHNEEEKIDDIYASMMPLMNFYTQLTKIEKSDKISDEQTKNRIAS